MVELYVFFSVFSKSPVDVLLYFHNVKSKKEKKKYGKSKFKWWSFTNVDDCKHHSLTAGICYCVQPAVWPHWLVALYQLMCACECISSHLHGGDFTVGWYLEISHQGVFHQEICKCYSARAYFSPSWRADC